MPVAGWVTIAVLAMALGLIVTLLARIRIIAGPLGSFECAMRRQDWDRWMSGIATFGDDSVSWYRLISLSPSPKYRLCRSDLVLGEVRHRGHDGEIVDVTCTVGSERFDLAMVEESHSALVAWLESAAPTQPTLF